MDELLAQAIAGAREAGAEILKHYKSFDFTTKDDGSPVTLADTASHHILLKKLSETQIPILSEESDPITSVYPNRLWIVDPMDGTKDFLNKTDGFSVMVGLIENGRPILGVVYAPVFDTLYYATRGGGACVVRGGTSTQLKAGARTDTLRFIRSVNHFTPDMQLVADRLSATLLPQGSIGLKAGLIGEDAGDFFYSWAPYGEWDVCAPEIIAIESGGMVTDCDGNPIVYGNKHHKLTRGAIFSNGACHAQVIEAIQYVTPKKYT